MISYKFNASSLKSLNVRFNCLGMRMLVKEQSRTSVLSKRSSFTLSRDHICRSWNLDQQLENVAEMVATIQ